MPKRIISKSKKHKRKTKVKSESSFLDQTKKIFDLSKNINKKRWQLRLTNEELEKKELELRKIQVKHELLDKKNSGLVELEKHLQNLSTKKGEHALIQALAQEIERLHRVVKSKQEVISQTHTEGSLSTLTSPQFEKSKNPRVLLHNYQKYQSEKKQLKEAIKSIKAEEIHFNLFRDSNGVSLKNDGTKVYKADFLKVNDTYAEIGNHLIRTYYLADIPAYLSPYVFFKLITSSLPFKLSIHIEPTSSGQLVKKARQRLSVLEMQQNDRATKGKSRDPQLEKSAEEINSFIEDLTYEREKGLVYALYLSIEAGDKEELKKLHKELKNLTDSMEMTFNTYTYGQKKALPAYLPFNTDHIKANRILQSTAASYLLPFVSKQLHDPEGVFLGINAYHDSLVYINPFTPRNSNVNIFGVSGAGKSVTAKLLATRLFMRGHQVLIIDPEAEYVDFVKKLGGEVVQFSRDNGINPFYINSTAEDDILNHISILKTFFKFFIPEGKYDSAILDEVLISLYDKGNPNFENLLKLLKKSSMHNYLKVLNEGSLRGVFNSKRRLELNNDLIVFDISPLVNTEKKAPAMYLLTSLIWNLVNRKSDRKRMLFIDEAHKLLVDHDVAVFYREMVKQARKRNLGVVSITQDVEDFLNGEWGKAIITNSETKILLKQSYATLNQIGSIYPMTDEEKQQLGGLGIGEVVLFRENEHMRVDVFVLPFEQQLLFPN